MVKLPKQFKQFYMNQILLEPNNFYQKVQKQINYAQETGALQSISTDYEIIKSGGIDFIVRIVTNLVRKEKAQKKTAKDKKFNPFLPYEKDLFVSDISETHLCLLNKYNVVEDHLLIVTREFESQKKWLNLNDFIAVGTVLEQFDGLAFYNAGKVAGASVKHKHLQVVPRELAHQISTIPLEAVMNQQTETIEALPFKHAYTRLNASEKDLAQISFNSYEKLVNKLKLKEISGPKKSSKTPYNLLMTKEWMLIIPRSCSSYQGIGINSLAFAGAMLVRNQELFNLVKEVGPLNILQEVTVKNEAGY
jgi:ATP adenylyltransferase